MRIRFWAGPLMAAAMSLAGTAASAAPGLPDTFAPDAAAPDNITDFIQKGLKSEIDEKLKDPYSAVYEFRPARRGSCKSGLFGRGGRKYGWVMEFTVNARNSFGAYQGPHPFTGLLYDQTQELVAWDGFRFGMMGYGACRFESDAPQPKQPVAPPSGSTP